MNIHAMRLHPHQDLQTELDNWAQEEAIEAACVLTCVGSLRQATLRFADQPDGICTRRYYCLAYRFIGWHIAQGMATALQTPLS